MTVIGHATGGRAALTWRTLEWWAAGMIVFVQSGAVLPLLMAGPDGGLDDAARAKLRLVALPVYLVAFALLARHPQQLLVALRRNVPFLLLIGLAFLSVMWSISPSFTLKKAVGLVLTLQVSFLIAIRFTPKQFLLLVATVLGVCMVLSLLLVGIAPRLAFMPMDGELRGVFIHKNVLGWATSLSVLVAVVLVVDSSLGLRRVGVPLLVVSCACLALSGSMTSVLAVAAALVLTWYFRLLTRSHGFTRILLFIAFPQIAIVLMFLLGEYLVPFLEAIGKDATLTGRVPLWHLADAQIAQRPMLGHGFSAFWSPASGEAWLIRERIGWMAPHAHSGYRDTLLSLGFVGAGLTAYVIVRALCQGVALHLCEPRNGWIWLNVLIGMFLIMNLSETLLLSANDFPWIIFAAGLIMISLRFPDRPGGGRHGR
ncbi:O-antigen ligase family protein [Paracoccaceae bacterium Fryx2]|nr:O-antigen ligase family protein [Paracoccaceae bacterium Fryx2]